MFEIYAANDETGQVIAKKYSLIGALSFATEILDCWNVVTIYELKPDEKPLPTSTMIARLWHDRNLSPKQS